MPALIDDQLIQMLRCPQDHSSLLRAEQHLVERTNRAIATGKVVNVGGQRVKKSIDGGLVREAGDVMYLIIDEIPVMLPDEAIDLTQLAR